MNPTDPAVLPSVDRLLRRGIEAGLHAGAQVYVSRRGETVADFAVGHRLPGADSEPITRDTLMVWFSAGKPITAVAVAQQVEQGRLDLDAPVARYIPEFAQQGKDAITVRHVLTHTGGFRAAPYQFPRDDWDTILARICTVRPEPRWTPGEKAGYHATTGWFILGELVQRVSGERFPEYVRRHIFEPAGMRDSWVGMPAERYDAYGPRVPTVLDAARQPPTPNPGYQDRAAVTACSPGSNACGPMRELGRFYEVLLAGGQGEGGAILQPETVEQLTSPQRVGMHDHTFRYPIDMGLGFIRNSQHNSDALMPYGYGPHASPQAFGHSGVRSTTGFADPAPGRGLVVAVGFNGMPTEAQHQERMHAVLGAVYEELGV